MKTVLIERLLKPTIDMKPPPYIQVEAASLITAQAQMISDLVLALRNHAGPALEDPSLRKLVDRASSHGARDGTNDFVSAHARMLGTAAVLRATTRLRVHAADLEAVADRIVSEGKIFRDHDVPEELRPTMADRRHYCAGELSRLAGELEERAFDYDLD